VDARTGGILGLASKPGFYPNVFIPPGDSAAVRTYFQDTKNLPLFNRAVGGTYPLGSIFKTVTAYAALEAGLIQPSSVIECRGKSLDRGDAFRCWLFRQEGRSHGPLTLTEALEQSCNCYFFELGKRLTLEQVEDAARKFGLGKPTGVEQPGERRGMLPSYARPRRWSQPDTMSLCIGQSTLMVTPLQAAQLMTTIAAGGRGIALTLTEPRAVEGNAADPQHVHSLLEGLRRVVNGSRGTAKDSGMAKFHAAGKTSSAQTGVGKEAHGWFGGFAPFDDPKYVVVTLVEHGTSGGHAAAPVAARIMEKLFP
jgi:penicillin-binding protein 2